ncbi:DEAD-box ATP-dependent RNA helicase 57 [Physcomitrium patens]|uniref:RNA helicase n=1 Tax=Physcomitrium patens TaxID=3218 RepID=A0A2K1JZZ5_PHYPA|nr:DEAD-box ATP-dependent RNA helicase 57-like [Physcomitrium patens]PNR47095.1 hypothetical protein PHYPA_014215 [Physcomitrium patens]|eukprot:XP_024386499.1 DEAD-box ATP-dependent RNA helicase 57-like [Physcomitrella patens]
MDPSFLFAGVRLNTKKFAADVNRFRPKKDDISVKDSEVAVSAAVSQSGVESNTQSKKRKRKNKENESETTFNLFKRRKSQTVETSEVDQDDQEPEPAQGALPEAEVVGLSRKKYQIHVSGRDVPAPLVAFEQLRTQYRCRKYLMKNIKEAGYTEPTPIQRQAITTLLAERECFACAPTGSGKTLAFSLPILMKLRVPSKEGLRALVLCPTRELALQTTRELKKLTVGTKFRVRVMTKALALCNDFSNLPCDILVSTPLRLDALLKGSKIDLSKVEFLVLDESDKLFEMGFVEQIDSVVAACTNPKIVRTLFSATLPDTVEELARSIMHDAIRITIGERNSASQTVRQRLVFVGSEEGKILALRQIFNESLRPPVLIFVKSKERAAELHKQLAFDNLSIDSIHADRTQAQRDAAVERFREGKTWVLIATDLMGRGMDFKGLNCVINYDFPPSISSYIHRVGRSGRAGRAGEAVTFYTEDDVPLLRSVAYVIFSSGGDVPAWMLSLPKVQKRKFKPRDSESNETTPATGAADKKQSSKSPSQKPMVKSEGFKKTKESTTKTGNRMEKKNFKVSSKNPKILNKNKKVKK